MNKIAEAVATEIKTNYGTVHPLALGYRTTQDLLAGLLAKYPEIDSDAKLARKIGVTRQRIHQYKKNQTSFSDDVAITVADLLDIDPLHALAIARAERSGNRVAREQWIQFVSKMNGGLFAFLGLAILVHFALSESPGLSFVPAAFSATPFYTLYEVVGLALALWALAIASRPNRGLAPG